MTTESGRSGGAGPKARGRPKSEAKKRQIHAAAVDLFVRHGYEGTSMDRVAELANVSKQTVYSHFESKDHLFREAVAHLCDALGLLDDLDQERRPLRTLLNEIGVRVLTLFASAEAVRLYRLVVGNAAAHPEVARMFYETGPRSFISRMSALLEQRSSRGEVSIAAPGVAAAQFFAMLRGELHMRVALGVQSRVTRKEVEAYVRACVEVFLRGNAP